MNYKTGIAHMKYTAIVVLHHLTVHYAKHCTFSTTVHLPVSCKAAPFWQPLGATIFLRKEEAPESSSGACGFLILQSPWWKALGSKYILIMLIFFRFDLLYIKKQTP